MSSKQKLPSPFAVIDCQSLLEQDGTYSGWLEIKNNGLNNKWLNRFVALNRGHGYMFKNPKSKNHINDFSLYGCNGVQPIESSDVRACREGTWIFKVVFSDGNSKQFAAASRNDRQSWIATFQTEIQFANNIETPSTYVTDEVSSLKNPHARVYGEKKRLPVEGMSPDMCQQKHFNRRKAVYGISNNRPLPKPPVDTPPPSLPTRQSTQYPNDHVFRNSHADNDHDEQELDEEDYYNIKDDGNGYLSCMETPMERQSINDVYDDFEGPYKNIPKVAYRVIAIEPFSSVYNNHFSFEKNEIFNVVNRAAEGWLVGEKDGQTGVFPEQNIMRWPPADEYAPLYGDRTQPTVYDSLWLSGCITHVDEHPKCERQSNKGHNSSYTVKAIESYTAGYRNEISFCKDDIFEVVGKESDRWLIGKINDRTGLFRSEYVTKCTFQSIDRTQEEGNKSHSYDENKMHT
ncbi:Hypothetical predicted protein [Mytilus galloprovincialis]|uniref:Uncharacterized protein n=1 Tax=Mytilus galloprovincialis TaxID=29158 RepID=A0A8B6GKZ3_MYTGA|nr:Hypothetical predicted protein [Mytilus galloprovincialis]